MGRKARGGNPAASGRAAARVAAGTVTQDGVSISTGSAFFSGSSGRWAGEQFLKALQAGNDISPAALRTLDTLRHEDWIEFDNVLLESAVMRLRGIADLRTLGLTKTLRGGLGKTVLSYERIGDMNEAQVSMDGRARTEDDALDFDMGSLPLPIIHKDFKLNLRTLLASRSRGEGLDTAQVRVAGRKIGEKLEQMLFLGGPQFAGLPIYGITNHPAIIEVDFSDGPWNLVATEGDKIIADVLKALDELDAAGYYGPYGVYLPSRYGLKLSEDFKANSDKTIRQRLLEIENIRFVTTADQMPADKVAVIQLTEDVITLVEGEPLQNVQWDIEGGFQICFKAFTLQVPLIRDNGKTGDDLKTGIAIIKAA